MTKFVQVCGSDKKLTIYCKAYFITVTFCSKNLNLCFLKNVEKYCFSQQYPSKFDESDQVTVFSEVIHVPSVFRL